MRCQVFTLSTSKHWSWLSKVKSWYSLEMTYTPNALRKSKNEEFKKILPIKEN